MVNAFPTKDFNVLKPVYRFAYKVPNSCVADGYRTAITNVFEGPESEADCPNKYFGALEHDNPKQAAEEYAFQQLAELYGAMRAMLICLIPQFVNKMRFGCGVSIIRTRTTNKDGSYPVLQVGWTEFENGETHRKKKTRNITDLNDDEEYEVAHQLNLFAARKRAEIIHSVLDEGVLSLEFDLSVNRRPFK